MSVLPFTFLLVYGITLIAFPKQWRQIYVASSMLTSLHDFWQRQDDVVYRVLGEMITFVTVVGLLGTFPLR